MPKLDAILCPLMYKLRLFFHLVVNNRYTFWYVKNNNEFNCLINLTNFFLL